MTERQRIALQADWWPAACRAQGWKVSDRVLRLRVCAWAVSLMNPTQLELLEAINSDRRPARQLESTNDLDNKEDVDRVKACLGMLAENLKLTGEVGQPQIGRARRLRDVIRDQIKCLGVYIPRPRAYVAKLIDDKFNSWRTYGPHLTIKDLTDEPIFRTDKNTGEVKELPSQLDQLVMTIGGCLNGSGKRGQRRGFRVEAGDTLHEMKMKAGVRCDCAQCQKASPARILPPLPIEEDWSDFDPELETVSCSDPELGCAETEESNTPF